MTAPICIHTAEELKLIKERFYLATKHLQKEVPYLAAVSGGRDSMVLTSLLKEAGFKTIFYCHLHHGTRKTAERDLQHVQNYALISESRLIYDRTASHKGLKKTEADLRRARLEFFAQTMRQTEAQGVFLGHHADDQAETFLWNLLRGAGTEGLAGMNFETELTTNVGPVRLLRPMLEIWREEIDRYILDKNISYMEDETNRSRRFTRNRLRHDILPWLEKKLERNVRQNLLRTASILREENQLIETLHPFDPARKELLLSELQILPVALQRRQIQAWLNTNHPATHGFDDVEAVRSLLDLSSGPARVNLPQNYQARRRAGKISLARQSD